MDIKEALNFGYITLKKNKITSAHLDAEVILSFVLNRSKEFLYTNSEIKLDQKSLSKYKSYLKKRSQFLPIAYITHKKEFYGREFFVNKDVLIPRPETEILIGKIKEAVGIKDKITIVDIGTGSGIIAITLKKILPKAQIIACEK